MMQKKWVMQISGLFLSILVCGITACSHEKKDEAPPTFVTIGTVQEQAFQKSVQATATINPIKGTQLKSEVAGRITKVYFTPGQNVHEGDPLIDINPTVLAAQLKSAQATEALDKTNYERSLKLRLQGIVAKADFDHALADQRTAEAAVAVAQANLDQAHVKAPFDGKVGINLVDVGNYVAVADPLLNIEQLDTLRVDFSIPEQYASLVQLKDPVIVAPHDNTQATYTGAVSAIDTAVDANTRMLFLRALFQNPKHALLPGEFAQVTLYYGPEQKTMVLPQTAIMNKENKHTVYSVVNQHAKEVPVTVGERFGDSIVILSGLKPGDAVVTVGSLKVHEGALVLDPTKLPPPSPEKKAHGA